MAIALTFLLSAGLFAGAFFHFLTKEKQKSSELFGGQKRLESEVSFWREEKEKLEKKSEEKISALQEKLSFFEKQNELLSQAQQQFEKQRQDWTKDKETILFKLSEDLMKRNFEQQAQASLAQEQNIKKITENLFKNFESVTQKLGALDDEVKKSTQAISDTKSALLSPGGAGRSSEITLENILKNSNLLEKENLNSVGDYVLQSHFKSVGDSQAKRPDAIVFLPNEQILVIDSKSSPHFLDFFEAERSGNEAQKKEIATKIKEAFRRHLEDLKRKDYEKFLFDELRAKNAADYRIFSAMFFQTEQMLEVLKKVDRDFEQRALEAGIILASPVVLVHLLSNVKFIIDRFKQEKNIEALKIEMRKLLDSLVGVIKESSELGRLINRSLAGYNKLAKNLNRATTLGKNIAELGIEGKKSAELKTLEEIDEVAE
jgi:DNA recombination protein RmuC